MGDAVVVGRRYDRKVAVVTGAASGIGRAITCRIVAEGGSVVGGDLNDDGLERLARELGDPVVGVATDVRKESEVAALVGTAVERFGRIDVAFNAAGLGSGGPVWELSEETWDATVDVCLKGCFFAVKHEALQLVKQGVGGAIVNIASLNSRVPMRGGSPYTASKAAVEMLTMNAALELAEYGIRVTAISPGLIATPLTEPLLRIPGAKEAYLERIPLGRVGTPEEIAATAAFLGSDEASYVSGANVFVDGGWALSGYPDLRPFLAKGSEADLKRDQ